MAKDLFKRYIWLIDTIYQAKRITFAEINDKWERSSLSDGERFPKKTFHNHKAAVEDLFDIIIECDAKDKYKYYIANVEDIDTSVMHNWLLNTFTISNLINESQKIKSRIQFETIPSGQYHLAPIIEAMNDNISLEINYQSYGKNYSSIFRIEPYFVKIFKQRWYVVAYSEGMDKIMTYALDRIKQLSLTQKQFEFPLDLNPDEYFNDCYGIINDENIDACTVKIKVDSYQAEYLKGLPLHHSQREIGDGEDMVFEFYIKPTFDFKKELLSMGLAVEILEPMWLRNEIKLEIDSLANSYH